MPYVDRFHQLLNHNRVKNSTVKLELASQPWNFFRVLEYESVQAWVMVQSWWSSRLRNNSTRKSMALTCKILSKQKSHTWHADQVAMESDKTKGNLKHLVSHRSPFVQLEEPFAVLFWTSSWIMLYNCSYFDGSEEYLFSSLWQKRIKSIEIKKKKQPGTARAPKVTNELSRR